MGVADHGHLEADAAGEISLRTTRNVARILLEGVRRIEQDGSRASGAEPGGQRLVDRDHGRAGLARTHDREHPCMRRFAHGLPPRRSPLCQTPSPMRPSVPYLSPVTPAEPLVAPWREAREKS